MEGLKKINNNVLLCRDGNGQEVIAMGRGLGFAPLPREVPLGEIERTFYQVNSRYIASLEDLPKEVMDFCADMMDIVASQIPCELSPNAVFTLADHIAFALERTRKRIHIRMLPPFDLQQMYPDEWRSGKYIWERACREFGVQLPREEIVGIAMNLINSRVGDGDGEKNDRLEEDARMLDDITHIIESRFRIIIDREGFNYSRFVTHMEYLFQRIHRHERVSSDNLQMYDTMIKGYPDIAACVDKIAAHISKTWDCSLSEEEKLYLMLHINRICSKEGL